MAISSLEVKIRLVGVTPAAMAAKLHYFLFRDEPSALRFAKKFMFVLIKSPGKQWKYSKRLSAL